MPQNPHSLLIILFALAAWALLLIVPLVVILIAQHFAP